MNYKYNAVTSALCAPETGLVTSAKGLGGSMDTLAEMKTNIGAWGACGSTTAFLDAWLSAPRKDLEEAGVLTEWFKHVDCASGFAVAACVEIKFTARSSSRCPPRHRRDACSMAWGCRFLTARPSQDGRAIAEK